MQTLKNTDQLPRATFATIGFFDGVHLGHRFLLEQLKIQAEKEGLETLVVSFANSPQQFFLPQKAVKLLTTADEKLAIFDTLGLQNCLLLDFDNSLATNTSEQFLAFLKNHFSVKQLLVGYDHHFGSDTHTTFESYVKIGEKIGVEVVACQPFVVGKTTVSSSKIREQLAIGNVQKTNELLGSKFTLSGVVTSGNQIGRQIGFPTANLEVASEKIVPKNGVYAVEVAMESAIFRGMLNIGERPTVAGKNRTIEVHIIDFSGDLYGKKLSLQFVKRLRDEHNFATLEQLRKQLLQDKKMVLSL